MKNQPSFEISLMGAATEYANASNDKDFNVIVEITCKDGVANATVVDNDIINGYVLSAISGVCRTDNPESFVEHNQTAIRIARMAAMLALTSKGGE